MSDKEYKCIVAEDEALVRRNLVKKINQLNAGFTVVGEVMDGESAIKLIQEELPNLVITDIQMPVKNGIELIKYLYLTYPTIKVIVISGFDEFEYARQAVKYDVKEYLLKPVSTKDLLSSITKVKMLLDSELSALDNCQEQNISPEELVELIELYIKNNYHKDISIADIAEHLHFAPDYLARVYKKVKGQTPLKYLINLRINEAKQYLITRPDLSVKAVGEFVGYNDQYYFSRLFKNCTGYYPTDYRSVKLKK